MWGQLQTVQLALHLVQVQGTDVLLPTVRKDLAQQPEPLEQVAEV